MTRVLDDSIIFPNEEMIERRGEQQGTVPWLLMRQETIGASDIAAMMGAHPWKTRRQVYRDKIEAPDPTETNERMEWGLRLEEPCRKAFIDKVHLGVHQTRQTFRYPKDNPCIHYSPDGIVMSDEDIPVGILEIKTTAETSTSWDEDKRLPWWGDYDWEKFAGQLGYFKHNPIPFWAWLQVQQALYITGLEIGYIALLRGGNDFSTYHIPAMDREIFGQYVFVNARNFMDLHVRDKVVPKIDPYHPQARRELTHHTPVSGSICAFHEGHEHEWSRILEMREEKKELDKRIKEAENQIYAWMGDNEQGTFPSGGYIHRKLVKVKAHYRKASESVRFYYKKGR